MFEQLMFLFEKSKYTRICRFPNCGRKADRKRLCKIHLKQFLNGHELTPIVQRRSPKETYPKEYNSWKLMNARCYNPKHPSYKYCGARGFTVCDRWRKSFWNFLEDVGPATSKDHSIDRINNDLGYFPENVRWATATQQAHNTRKCRWITFEGESMLVGDLAKKVKISEKSLRKRILKDGLTPEEAVRVIKQTRNHQNKNKRKALRRSFP